MLPRYPLPDLKASWGAIYTIPSVAPCGTVLDPLQQQWEFLTINTTRGNISDILSNAYVSNAYDGINSCSGNESQIVPRFSLLGV